MMVRLRTPAPRVLLATALVLAVAAGAWTGRFLAPENAPGPTAARVERADPLAHARLSAVVAWLDRARVDGRAALERARTREAQAALARRLRDAHRRSAASLEPTHGALSRELHTTSRAYGALAAAARDGSHERFDAARRRARAADATLAAAVDDAPRTGAKQVVRSAAATKSSARWTDPLRLLVLAIVMLIIAAAGVSVGHGIKPGATRFT